MRKGLFFTLVGLVFAGFMSTNTNASQRERLYACQVITAILDECANTPMEMSCLQMSDYVHDQLRKKGLDYDTSNKLANMCFKVCNNPVSWTMVRKRVFLQCVYNY